MCTSMKFCSHILFQQRKYIKRLGSVLFHEDFERLWRRCAHASLEQCHASLWDIKTWEWQSVNAKGCADSLRKVFPRSKMDFLFPRGFIPSTVESKWATMETSWDICHSPSFTCRTYCTWETDISSCKWSWKETGRKIGTVGESSKVVSGKINIEGEQSIRNKRMWWKWSLSFFFWIPRKLSHGLLHRRYLVWTPEEKTEAVFFLFFFDLKLCSVGSLYKILLLFILLWLLCHVQENSQFDLCVGGRSGYSESLRMSERANFFLQYERETESQRKWRPQYFLQENVLSESSHKSPWKWISKNIFSSKVSFRQGSVLKKGCPYLNIGRNLINQRQQCAKHKPSFWPSLVW